ncbi:hypothetical protein [Tahibacter caeni]|uniref:hypothetical protein n=1 Tax=Tahibacter caeni TaxID=1453545 RepID=UPI0021484560|nr:hypothetical protein [Tahibacter caeni]
MIRFSALALVLSLAAGTAAAHSAGSVDLSQPIPAGALQYGGWIAHNGVQTHTFLAPTYGECATLLQQSAAQHTANAPYYYGSGHPSTYTIEPCSKRAMFQLFAPGDPDGDLVTVTVSIPSRYARDVDALRQRYQYDQYMAEFERLFPVK